MTYVFLLILAGLHVLASMAGATIKEPVRLFLLSWIISGVLLVMGLVEYDRVFIWTTFLSVTTGIVAFTGGALLCRGRHGGSTTQAIEAREIRLMPAGVTPFVVAVALAYSVIEMMNAISLFSKFNMESDLLAALRQEHWDDYGVGRKTWMGTFEGVGRVAAFFMVTSIPIFLKRCRRRLAIVGVLAGLALIVETFSGGGRSHAVYALTALCYAYWLVLWLLQRRIRGLKGLFRKLGFVRSAAFCTAALGLVYFLFVVFPAWRNPNLADHVDQYLSYSAAARVSDRTHALVEITGMESLEVAAYGLSYLSSPIVAYTFFAERRDIGEMYALGSYNVSLISKARSLLTGERSSWFAIRNELAESRARYRLTTNPWATGLRDFVIDFGYFGAVVAMFAFGYFCQWCYHRAARVPTIEAIALASVIAVICLTFAYFSGLVAGSLRNTMTFCLLVMAYRGVLQSLSGGKRPRRRLMAQPGERRGA